MTNKSKPFQMRVAAEWLADLDNYRWGLKPPPSRAEAIRRLVTRYIVASKARKTRVKK